MEEMFAATMTKLTRSNYWIWKPRMDSYLYVCDLHETIEGDQSKPEGKSDIEWEVMHAKAVGLIMQCIDSSILPYVALETNANSLWMKLESLCQRTTQDKLLLVMNLFNLKHKPNCSMSDHINDFCSLVYQLGDAKISLDDELQALLLLSTLPDSWENVILPLSISAPNGKLTLDIVKQRLYIEEIRRRDRAISGQLETLVIDGQGRSKSKAPSNHDKSRGRSQTRRTVRCYHCGIVGHYQRECRKLKREQSN